MSRCAFYAITDFSVFVPIYAKRIFLSTSISKNTKGIFAFQTAFDFVVIQCKLSASCWSLDWSLEANTSWVIREELFHRNWVSFAFITFCEIQIVNLAIGDFWSAISFKDLISWRIIIEGCSTYYPWTIPSCALFAISCVSTNFLAFSDCF